MAALTSNYQQTKARLRDNITASVPLVIIRTNERHRAEKMVKELAEERRIRAFSYTDARQVVALGHAAPAKNVDSDPLPFARDLFLKNKNVTFLLADTRRLGQDSLYTRELLTTAYLARETKNTLVVVAPEDVWPRLSAVGQFLKLGLPDFGERLLLVVEFVDKFSGRVNWGKQAQERMATLTRGLTEIQITNLLRSALAGSTTLTEVDISRVASSKELLFAQVPNVIPVERDDNLKVAGLGGLKGWLESKKDAFFAPDSVLSSYGLAAPKGILLAGVPGCGKSYSAKMVASMWGLPLFRFDMGSVYNKYVGETERQMQEALEYVDNVAPCVLWIDEIEKALSVNSGESDVGKRILGQFLFWLQESHAKVFLVATANDVTSLPPELFRKGRFSETFFVDLPNAEERSNAIELYARISLHHEYLPEELLKLVEVSDGFSYSDIEQVIKGLAEAMLFGKTALPSTEELSDAFKRAIPISKADERVCDIRKWGKAHAIPASLEVPRV